MKPNMGSIKAKNPRPYAEPFTALRQRWTTLWTTTLPRLASARSEVQNDGNWPVTVDHAFARVILDNIVGVDRPWPEKLAAPATANMTEKQLEACIALAEQITEGAVKLDNLQDTSLKLRGIAPNHMSTGAVVSKKRKRSDTSSKETPPSKTTSRSISQERTRKQQAAHDWSSISLVKTGPNVPSEEAEMIPDIQLIIAQSILKPFQKEALTFLALVPRGRWTTYQAISNAMRKSQQKTEAQSLHQASGHARAVGMAMRNNPFAPTVPCHRMLSSDRRIGGFHGDWEGEGTFFHQKTRLLIEECVEFDKKGRALGEPFTDFDRCVTE